MKRHVGAQGRSLRGVLSSRAAVEVAVTLSASLVMVVMVAVGGVAAERLASAEAQQLHLVLGAAPYDGVASEPFSRAQAPRTDGAPAEPDPLPPHESS